MFGVYVHIPFCRSRCAYCDFPIVVSNGENPSTHAQYASVLEKQMFSERDLFVGREVSTIYFGGGTPSLWPSKYVAKIVNTLRASFSVTATCEVTLEANPADCTIEKLERWKAAGVTRLSIGLQSLRGSDLVTLGRDPSMGYSIQDIDRALACGFSSISVDILFGVPGQRGQDWTSALSPLLVRKIPHISIYELTWEPGTLLYHNRKLGKVRPLSPSIVAEDYVQIDGVLTQAGYQHYEISSYALPEHHSRHNTTYWHGGEYWGVGMGAASMRRNKDGTAQRWQNTKLWQAYMADSQAKEPESQESLSAVQVASDDIWLGLRTQKGVTTSVLASREKDKQWLVDSGFAKIKNGRMCPTIQGFLFHNQILARFCQ